MELQRTKSYNRSYKELQQELTILRTPVEQRVLERCNSL